jgi:2-C-methyl-D-erythritol 4-phosphate cytidylyltransferase / 2-C-methyl-D-erythritol 2,4-cyclodiphosphate synthase
MNSLILVAAGEGRRFGAGGNKLLAEVCGMPLIEMTLRHVMQSSFLDEVILVTVPKEREMFSDIVRRVGGSLSVRFADGGRTRTESVAHGLAMVSDDAEIVLVHDGARPGVAGADFDRLISVIEEGAPAALFAVDCVDTIKETDETGYVVRTLCRSRLKRAQTPQGARALIFRECMARALRENVEVTDDASVLEACGVPVRCVPGQEEFFKVTFPEDAKRMEKTEAEGSPPFRIGQGYDIHCFAADRPLVLGGVKIRETDGLLGHSDADVLIHAVMDALLGAAGLPDIGHWFPDTDARFAGVSSLVLLERVREIIEKAGYKTGNLDVTILAETPKISPYKEKMRENLAKVLQILPDQISVKATTNEKLGAIGRREGIAAMAVALLFRK